MLNIDNGLQQAVQNALAAQILADRQTRPTLIDQQTPPAANGAVVVMNPQNGQVLALASYPTYDLNQWVGGISAANFAALQSDAERRTTTPSRASTRRARPSSSSRPPRRSRTA